MELDWDFFFLCDSTEIVWEFFRRVSIPLIWKEKRFDEGGACCFVVVVTKIALINHRIILSHANEN